MPQRAGTPTSLGEAEREHPRGQGHPPPPAHGGGGAAISPEAAAGRPPQPLGMGQGPPRPAHPRPRLTGAACPGAGGGPGQQQQREEDAEADEEQAERRRGAAHGGGGSEERLRGARPAGGERDAAAATAFMPGRGQPLGTAGTARRWRRPRPAPPPRGLRLSRPGEPPARARRGWDRGSASGGVAAGPGRAPFGARRPPKAGAGWGWAKGPRIPARRPVSSALSGEGCCESRPCEPGPAAPAPGVGRHSGSLERGGSFRKRGPPGRRAAAPPAAAGSATLRAGKKPLEHNKESKSSG